MLTGLDNSHFNVDRLGIGNSMLTGLGIRHSNVDRILISIRLGIGHSNVNRARQYSFKCLLVKSDSL